MREPQSPADAGLNALLGPGSVVEGKLSFKGQVRIEGTFTGEITTTDLLIVGETAKVSANINCGSVVVNGEQGDVGAVDEIHQAPHLVRHFRGGVLILELQEPRQRINHQHARAGGVERFLHAARA